MESMNIGQVDASDIYADENKDWKLSNIHATFTHKEACEFIFYIGGTDEGSTPYQEKLDELKGYGFSELFRLEVKAAQSKGFNYLCFYA